MAHTAKDKKKLLNRIRRIRGQIDAVERLIEQESEDCTTVLQTIAACRGAINALMAEVIEGHIRHHVLTDSSKQTKAQNEALETLIEVVNSYLK
ncbi:MAG: metal/formaldehyde-sensitive transcriptional repressor [Blastocatellia bacterium]